MQQEAKLDCRLIVRGKLSERERQGKADVQAWHRLLVSDGPQRSLL